MPKISLLLLLLELYINIGLIEYNFSFYSTENIINSIETTNIITYLKNLILISSILSLIIGSTLGLSQLKIKRLLAYSTQYSLTNLNIFLIIIALGLFVHSLLLKDSLNSIEYEGSENDIQYITKLKGIFFNNPLLSLSLSICLFSMAGIPSLIGFFS